MLKDNVILEDETNKVLVNQHSFCELIKYILIDYAKICYEDASKIVDSSNLALPIKSVMDAALISHEYTYYWAMLLYYGNNYLEKGVLAQPKDLTAYFEYENGILDKYNLKEPFEWIDI